MRITNRYLIILALFPLLIFVSYFLVVLFIGYRAEEDTKIRSDALLVLGARSYIDGKYNPCLESRVVHAVELYKAGYAAKFIVSGGDDIEDNVNEAETMKKIAIEHGVKVEDILLEKQATSTYENFTLSKEVLKKHNLQSVIIVTEPFHIARATLVAEKLGYRYTVSPAVKSPCWQPNNYLTKYFLKEPFAIAVYKLQNKL